MQALALELGGRRGVDLIVVTGGLGTTLDDVTRTVVAEWTGRPLVTGDTEVSVAFEHQDRLLVAQLIEGLNMRHAKDVYSTDGRTVGELAAAEPLKRRLTVAVVDAATAGGASDRLSVLGDALRALAAEVLQMVWELLRDGDVPTS